MRTLPFVHRLVFGLTLSLALGWMTAAHAQGAAPTPEPAPPDPWQAHYQAELAKCAQLGSAEAIADCRREAHAAYQTARKGELEDPSSEQLRENALRRCQNLPADLRDDCFSNMRQGGNTETQGSVSGGGILRRTEIIIPAAPATN